MERCLQYLDELDDMVGIIGLCGEQIRRALLLTLSTILVVAVLLCGVVLALKTPTFALATVTMLFVLLLRRLSSRPGLKYAD